MKPRLLAEGVFSICGIQIFVCNNAFSLTPAQSGAAGFTDTAGSYAKQEIDALAEAGIVSGYKDGTFRPDNITTRAEAAKVIVLAMGLSPNPEPAASFRDVSSVAWYGGYVGALVQSGIAKGTGPDRFSPEASVTREELAVFFIRAFGLEQTAHELFNGDETDVIDYADVSDWAKPHVALGVHLDLLKGIVQADGATAFRPKAAVDRQALARLAYEYAVNRETYMSRVQTLLPEHEDGDATAAVASVTVINATTVHVTFDSAAAAVNPADFWFEPQLTVKDAALREGSDTIVVLTTAAQTPGATYKLFYKGEATGFAITGAGSAADYSSGSQNSQGSEQEHQEEQPNAAELLASGQTLADVTIVASGIYGPSDESGLTTVFTGTLTIDPGPEGEVTLRNIEAENLEVLSGNDESIKLMQMVVKHLRVNATNNNGRDVRIEARDGVNIESTAVESQAILESASISGQFGAIRLAAAVQTITLRGAIDNVVVDAPGSVIRLDSPSSCSNAMATNVRLLLFRANTNLLLAEDTGIATVNVSGTNMSLAFAGEGSIASVFVDASAEGTVLSLGESMDIGQIEAESDIVLSGDPAAILNTAVVGAGTVYIDDNIKDEVKAEAVGSAMAAIDAMEPFSV